MKKQIIFTLILCTVFIFILALNKSNEIKIANINARNENLSKLVMSRNEAEIFAEAVIYMIDLNLKTNEKGENIFDITTLNQEYVNCFNPEYLNYFLTNQPTHIIPPDGFASEEEKQYFQYESNKKSHKLLTQHELILLEKYNQYSYDNYKILKYNDTILTKIAQKEGMTLEGLKSMRFSTPMSYDRVVGSDEEYSHLLKFSQIEMSQELKDFKNKYQEIYPFNYEVNLPSEGIYTNTTQYEANLYGFYYPNISENFYVSYTDEMLANKDNILQDKNQLLSYTVYNDSIEIRFDARNVNGNFMTAIAYITNGEIIDIYTYIIV